MTTPKDLTERLRDWPGAFAPVAMMREAADLIEQQEREIDVLTFQCDGANEAADRWRKQFVQSKAEIKALRAERDALKEDAERYRWLRDHASGYDAIGDPDNLISVWYGRPDKFSNAPTLDAAIDAAMAKLPPTWEQDTLRPD